MSATATAIAASAAASAAAANSAAIDARKRAECAESMPKFAHETASVSERQVYANCVDLIHPQEMTGPEVIVAKIVIVLAFVGAGIGARFGWLNFIVSRPLDAVVCGGLGAIILPAAATICAAALAAAWWLFQ